MKRLIPALLFSMVFCVPLAQAQVSITSVPFLQIEPDSRAAGMGNTGVALANNASAVFWNPAGLAQQRGSQVNITHAQWLPQFNADLFYDYLVGSHHVEGIGTFGGHITYLNLGEQLQTVDRGGEGETIGRFNSYELAVGTSFGFDLNDSWALGVGLRYIYSSLFDGTIEGEQRTVSPGSSFGVDLAAMYETDPFTFGGNDAFFKAGINLSNIGPGLNYTEEGEKDPLPTVFRLGWAFTTDLDQRGMHSITLANDISKVMARDSSSGVEGIFDSWGPYELNSQDPNTPDQLSTFQQFMVGTGLEYWYNDLFAVRSGYYFEDPNNGDRRFITIGAGIRYDFIGVDFSHIFTLEEEHPLANTTRFGLLLNF